MKGTSEFWSGGNLGSLGVYGEWGVLSKKDRTSRSFSIYNPFILYKYIFIIY
jgi:hypothetical protein